MYSIDEPAGIPNVLKEYLLEGHFKCPANLIGVARI